MKNRLIFNTRFWFLKLMLRRYRFVCVATKPAEYAVM
jgi:hypothetical protein